jgi:hypothetical protein
MGILLATALWVLAASGVLSKLLTDITKYRTLQYPVVRDVKTGKESVLILDDMKDIKRGRTYTFLYLKNTRIGVMSSVIWEDE